MAATPPPAPCAPRVAVGRPYGDAGIGSTAAWLRLPAERIDLATLVTTQRHVYLDALLGAAGGHDDDRPRDPLLHVVEWRGVRYLEDGHTRVARALLSGVTHLPGRVARPERAVPAQRAA